MHLLAIEIGGTKLQVCAGTADGRIHERARFAVDRAAGGAGIRAQIQQALPAFIKRWQPAAIGVGYGGPVDWKTGVIRCSHHVAGWADFHLAEWLTSLTRLPAHVENDANAAALGEALLGAGRGISPMLWMNSGTGIGGGLIVDGQLYHGAPPGEMELGHLRCDADGSILEAHAAGPAVDASVRKLAAAMPETPLGKLIAAAPTPGGEARYLAPAIAQNCPAAERELERIATHLARALAHAVHLLHPRVIVFGGGLSLVGEPLRAHLARALPPRLMAAMQPGPEIRLAALGEDAVPAGALLLAAQRCTRR